MNPRNTELGRQDVPSRYWYVKVGWVRLLISSTFGSLTLLLLYTEVSRNVISWEEVVRVNLRRLWKLFAVWKKFTRPTSRNFDSLVNIVTPEMAQNITLIEKKKKLASQAYLNVMVASPQLSRVIMTKATPPESVQ